MNKQFYYSPSVRDYIKQEFARFGYQFHTIDSVESNFDKDLILYETEIEFCIDHMQKFSRDNTVVIVIDHHFAKHPLMNKLDHLAEGHNFVFLGTQYLKPLYKNIKTHSLGSSEDWCRHDFIKYMVDKWHRERKPAVEKFFLFLSAMSESSLHSERNDIIFKIRSELKDDLLPVEPSNQTDLVNKKISLDKWITETFAGSNMLGGFGNGLPRFDLYDKTACELVLETVYLTETIHLSEKTWRPIACGQPAVYLINKSNIEHLQSLGYLLEPLSFYNRLKQSNNLNDAFDILKDSLEEIKNTDLSLTTKKNFNHFWRYRSVWEDYTPSLSNTFGYCNVEELMKKIKEI